MLGGKEKAFRVLYRILSSGEGGGGGGGTGW